MARRIDGRIEPGQKISTALSARAWNRAQDAADLVLGQQYGAQAGALSTAHLPSVRGRFNNAPGYFGQAIGLVSSAFSLLSSQPISVTPHSQGTNVLLDRLNTLGNFSNDEKDMVPFSLPGAGGGGTGIAICCGNDSIVYTISGYAITRVRVFNYNHRFARLPQTFPGETQEQAAEGNGALDSCFWGPAKIIGYRLAGPFPWQHLSSSPGLIYPNYIMAWALVVL
jgi:hypothetical protein